MWFTSQATREDFVRLVLHDMTYRDEVNEFARILEARMRDKVHGRMFLSAHMRRGDCEPFVFRAIFVEIDDRFHSCDAWLGNEPVVAKAS